MAEERLKTYPYCFGCGDANPVGLQLKHRMDGDRLVTEFVPREVHQGWPEIVHGGIIATMLYEAMENLLFHQGVVTMMRGMDTRFRRPATTGKKIIARSWLLEKNGRNIDVSAELTDESGAVIAEGKASLVVLSQKQLEKLGLD